MNAHEQRADALIIGLVGCFLIIFGTVIVQAQGLVGCIGMSISCIGSMLILVGAQMRC